MINIKMFDKNPVPITSWQFDIMVQKAWILAAF